MLDNLPIIIIAGVLVIFWVLAFIVLYHLVRFGVGRAPKIAAFVFFVGSLILMVVILIMWLRLDLAGTFSTIF